jgi:hypothetical protein
MDWNGLRSPTIGASRRRKKADEKFYGEDAKHVKSRGGSEV